MKFYEANKRSDVFTKLGMVLMELEREQEAIQTIKNGLEYNDSHPHLHDRMARMLLEAEDLSLRDPATALKHAQRAIELFQKDGEPGWFHWQTLGLALIENGQYFEALDAIEQMDNPEAAREIVRESITFARDERANDAQLAQELVKAIVSMPSAVAKNQLAEAHFTLALWSPLAQARSHATEKIHHFEASLANEPRGYACHDQLSRVYSIMLASDHQDSAKALFHAEKAFELYPGDPDAYVWATLGMAHFRAERWQQALEAFEKSRQSDYKEPGLPLGLYLALCNHRLGKVDEAQRLWNEFNPDDKRRYGGNWYKADFETARELFSSPPGESNVETDE